MKFYIYRNGIELSDHPANGGTFESSGPYIGRIGQTNVRRYVTIRQGRHEVALTAETFGGPVMVKQWYPGTDGRGHAEWFAVATVADVEAKGGTVVRYVDMRESSGWLPAPLMLADGSIVERRTEAKPFEAPLYVAK